MGATPRRRARGWVPDQHGAWAMLTLPLVAGVWLSGPRAVHLSLAATWLLGYLAFYAAGRWLRSRRVRERTPTLVYAGASLPLGAVTVLLAPQLVRWLPAFLPLLLASLWLTAHGRERSLANDAVTVVAAGLMTPVAFDAGNGTWWAGAWLVTALLTGYFLGTVLYVKTMIRERGRASYLRASVGYHLLITAAVTALSVTGWQGAWSVAVWALLVLRAAAGPWANARRSRPLRPVVVGVGEIIASLLVLATTLGGLPGT